MGTIGWTMLIVGLSVGVVIGVIVTDEANAAVIREWKRLFYEWVGK